MSETPQQLVIEQVEHDREHMVISAALLSRRLRLLEENRGPGMGYDFPSILSLMVRMRDAIESYRQAVAVEEAVSTLLSHQARRATDGGQEDGGEG